VTAAGVVVLDTNVWLDLYIFEDPLAAPVAHCLKETGRLDPVRCSQTDAEIEAVLRRPRFASAASAGPMQRWQALARPAALAAPAPWRCTDPDDQKFLDLAFATRAVLLLTRDKALLALNRRTERDGLSILTPLQFVRRCHDDGAAQGQGIVQRMVPA
jgi:predicted nucleic acid-binding protein